MKKEEENYIEFDADYLDEMHDINNETVEEIVGDAWDNTCKNHNYVVVVGSAGTWQGRFPITPHVLDNEIGSFLDEISSDIYSMNFKVYPNKIEFSGSHHDSTNYYTIIPFNYDMFKSSYINKIIEEYHEDMDEYLYNKTGEKQQKWYNSTKEIKIEFIENHLTPDTLPMLSISDFLKKYEITF